MGWASGFAAGADAARGWIDTYNEAKKAKGLAAVEQYLQGQQAEQQAALPAYEAEQQRLAGMTQPQFAAQQVGLGPAPMGSAQMSPVTAPPSAPVQPGLADPQRAAAGIGLPGQMAPEPGTFSPVSGQALGMGAAPKPMSEYDMEMERANQLRALGYTDEADKAYTRGLGLREEARNARRLEMEESRLGMEEERLGIAREGALLDQELARLNIDVKKLDLAERKATAAALDRYSTFKGSAMEFRETPEFRALTPKAKTELATSLTGTEEQFQKLGSLQLQSRLSKAQTLDDLAVMITDDKDLTPDEAVSVERNEETGEISFVYYNDIGGSLDYGKEVMRRTFSSEEEARANLQETAQDPFLGAEAYATSVRNANALAYQRLQDVQAGTKSIVELRTDLIAELLGDYESYVKLSENERLTIDGLVDGIMKPYTSMLGIGGTDMGGMSDVPDFMRGGTAR